MIDYVTDAALFKALSEPIRLKILDILSAGELCACDILRHLSIAQPTLSHHMRILQAAGWVTAEKRATWMYYALNSSHADAAKCAIDALTAHKDLTPDLASHRHCAACACCPDRDTSK
jgi:DNA-binding transcriptional ArsR family regulator